MKPPLVQILVVVANTQTRALKTEGRGPFGRCNSLGDSTVPRKGIGLIFLNRDADRPSAISGNASELGDVGRSPGKTS